MLRFILDAHCDPAGLLNDRRSGLRAGALRRVGGIHVLACLLLGVSAVSATAANVTMYTSQSAYLAAAPNQHVLDLSYNPGGNLATEYAQPDGLVFVAGQQPLGVGYNNSRIPTWNGVNRLANGSSYQPIIFKFVDPADGTTPVAMTSFFIHKYEGHDQTFALLDSDLSVIHQVNTSPAVEAGFISDTPFYSVFVAPWSANAARYGDVSWGLVPEPSALSLLALGGLALLRRRR